LQKKLRERRWQLRQFSTQFNPGMMALLVLFQKECALPDGRARPSRYI